MTAPLKLIGGRDGMCIYMRKGYDIPTLTVDEYVDRAVKIGVGRDMTVVAGTPSNPAYSWPVYAVRIGGT